MPIFSIDEIVDDVIRFQNMSIFIVYSFVDIKARTSIKSSKYRKCSWLSCWHIQLWESLPVQMFTAKWPWHWNDCNSINLLNAKMKQKLTYRLYIRLGFGFSSVEEFWQLSTLRFPFHIALLLRNLIYLEGGIVAWIHGPLTSYVKLWVAHAPGMPGTFSRHSLQRKPLVSYPSMHYATCATHVPYCMSGSLTRENVPGIPGACGTRKFTYLARGPSRDRFVWLLAN